MWWPEFRDQRFHPPALAAGNHGICGVQGKQKSCTDRLNVKGEPVVHTKPMLYHCGGGGEGEVGG